jgi:superfamily I DNA and/or RNA helicase
MYGTHGLVQDNLVYSLNHIFFSGSEWEYVILSTVRSLPRCEIEKRPTNGWIRRHLGFITNQNQINVGITRAKKGLIIVGKFFKVLVLGNRFVEMKFN